MPTLEDLLKAEAASASAGTQSVRLTDLMDSWATEHVTPQDESWGDFALGLVSAPLSGLTWGGSDEAIAYTAGVMADIGNKVGLTDETRWQAYDRVLQQQRDDQADFRARHPWVNLGGEVGGSMVMPGATLFKGVSLPGKVAAGVVNTAASAAPAGFLSGEGGFKSRAENAARAGVFGGGVGAAVPLIGAAGGPLLRQVGRVWGQSADDRVADLALEMSQDPKAAAEALEQFQPSMFGVKTTGEAAKDTGLARMERAARQLVEGEDVSQAMAERAAKREEAASALFDPAINRRSGSKQLEAVVEKANDALKADEADLWALVDKGTRVEMSDTLPAAMETVSTYFGDPSVALPPTLAGYLKRMGQLAESAPDMGAVQALRSDMLKVARKASDAKEAAVLNDWAEHLINGVDANVEAGVAGQDLADAWRAAREATRSRKTALEAFSNLSKAAGEGKGQLLDAKFMNEVLASPDKMDAVIAFAAQAGEDVRPQLKSALFDAVLRNPRTGNMYPQGQWSERLYQYKDALEKVATPEELGSFQKILDDIQSQFSGEARAVATVKVGRGQQSATAPFSRTLKKLEKERSKAPVVGRVLGTGLGLAAAPALSVTGPVGTVAGYSLGSLVDKGLSSLSERAASKFDEALSAFANSPKQAAEMLRGAMGRAAARDEFDAAIEGLIDNRTREAGILASKVDPKDPSEDEFLPSVMRKAREGRAAKASEQAAALFQPTSITVGGGAKTENGIDWDRVLDALRQVESGGGKHLVSPKGAMGPYQIMPYMAKAYGLADPMDEAASRAAARRILMDEYKALGNLEDALRAYNAGRPTVLEWRRGERELPQETQNYLPRYYAALKRLGAA